MIRPAQIGLTNAEQNVSQKSDQIGASKLHSHKVSDAFRGQRNKERSSIFVGLAALRSQG
jgi:hypothetical protein